MSEELIVALMVNRHRGLSDADRVRRLVHTHALPPWIGLPSRVAEGACEHMLYEEFQAATSAQRLATFTGLGSTRFLQVDRAMWLLGLGMTSGILKTILL
jgi:hypothetical protein